MSKQKKQTIPDILHGVNAKAVAKSMGTTTYTVRTWQRGRHVPQTRTLRKLAKALGMRLSNLVDARDRMKVKAKPAKVNGKAKPAGSPTWELVPSSNGSFTSKTKKAAQPATLLAVTADGVIHDLQQVDLAVVYPIITAINAGGYGHGS